MINARVPFLSRAWKNCWHSSRLKRLGSLFFWHFSPRSNALSQWLGSFQIHLGHISTSPMALALYCHKAGARSFHKIHKTLAEDLETWKRSAIQALQSRSIQPITKADPNLFRFICAKTPWPVVGQESSDGDAHPLDACPASTSSAIRLSTFSCPADCEA